MAPDRWELADHLTGVKEIRRKWLESIVDPAAYVPIYFDGFDTPAVGVAYVDRKTKNILLVLANADYNNEVRVTARLGALREKSGFTGVKGRLVYATYEFAHDFDQFTPEGDVWVHMGPGEVKIVEL
jgi:hypothetical protein